MTLPELEVFTTEVLGEKKFRAKQIYEWMHVRLADSFDEMTNLSKDLRQKLSEQCVLTHLEMVEKYVSAIDGTAKYLFKLSDDRIIESVLMHYKHGNSVCISSQVGCRMGCRFCASTLGGLERQMLASEMLDEIYQIQKDSGERVSNVVVMGTGEPLDNYDALVRMIDILTHAPGLDISQRNVTVSTCGLVPKIYELADLKLQITLAISLHAVNDEKRRELMPIANLGSKGLLRKGVLSPILVCNKDSVQEVCVVRLASSSNAYIGMILYVYWGGSTGLFFINSKTGNSYIIRKVNGSIISEIEFKRKNDHLFVRSKTNTASFRVSALFLDTTGVDLSLSMNIVDENLDDAEDIEIL